ncbi:MAG: helix-turn-helix transcriptional regulator [Desulfurococcales archaeon]|nr:helix-turn-helix transcriptional regulator [Desulfurococcales archaeon]
MMRGNDPLKYRLRFLILSLLAIKPSHGYELSRKIEALTRGRIKGSPGSMYPLLRELRDEGLVEEYIEIVQGRAKKVYRLTAHGAKRLYNQLNVIYDITSTFLQIAAKARESLATMFKDLPPKEECPDPEAIKKLNTLREMIEKYIDYINDRMEECKNKEKKNEEDLSF